jgi:hypothetical protein
MIELKSINLTFAITQIYRGLTLTSEEGWTFADQILGGVAK